MIRKIDHIAIAVNSIDESFLFYKDVLGLEFEGMEEVASQKVKTAFFVAGEIHIELLEPTDPQSPVAKFLEKNGPGIHHIAYAVEDVQESLDSVKDKGVRLINEFPVDGAHGKMIGFLHPKSTQGVLTEFCARNPSK